MGFDAAWLARRLQENPAVRLINEEALRTPALPSPLQEARRPSPSWPYRSRLEQRYAALLDVWVHDGQLVRWRYEALRLTLAPRTTLTVDFWLTVPPGMGDGRMQLHETKGWAREDSLIKLKQAATLYPEFRFFLVQAPKGVWQWKEIPTL